MGFSIQDYLKKINSSITTVDCLSLLVTALALTFLLLFLYQHKFKSTTPVRYYSNESSSVVENIPKGQVSELDPRPFASSKGKTYTFAWCQGGSQISSKNKIYFSDEEEAKSSGRTLSKLCKKK